MHYMYDLDSTLVDTREVRPYMKTREGRVFAVEHIDQIQTTADGVLKKLVEKQHSEGMVSIVTDSPEDYARAVLKKHGFPNIPVYAVANKPFNNGLGLAIADCGVPLEEIVVIGDSAKDILDAHQAKVKSVGVVSNIFTQEQLSLAEPTAIAVSSADLEEILNSSLIVGGRYEPRKNPGKLLYLPSEEIASASPEITNISIGVYTPWGSSEQSGFSGLSNMVLRFKSIRGFTVGELNGGVTDRYFSEGILRGGDQLLGIFWSLKKELLEKLKGVDFDDCLVVAAPNSLPEYCYCSDVNRLFTINTFNEKGFIPVNRFVFRAYPKQKDHIFSRSSEEVHYKTTGIKESNHRRFKQVLIFDDVRTRGTQTTALAKILRYFEFGDKFCAVTFGQT